MNPGNRPAPATVTADPHRRLRVGVVAPPFLPVPPSGYGGTERVVAVLTEGLVRAGHDVTLFAAPGSETHARLVTPLESRPPLGDPSSLADDVFHTVSAFLAAESFDVVHDHSGLGPALGAMLTDRVPVVHTLHGRWTAQSRRFLGLLDGRVHLVAISCAQRDANPGLRYAGVVHNGIDLSHHALRREKEEFVVFVGRINAEKRPEQAIEVARRAKRRLVMIVKRTEPAERAYWDEMVAPLLGPDVEVLDEPPHDVKVDVVGRARALVFPIDWPEPFGLVMTEAMACGTPVVARPLGAAPEVVLDGVTGVLCPGIEEMAQALDRCADLSPDECRARVERHFSAEAMVAGYERIYADALRELAARRRQSAARPIPAPAAAPAASPPASPAEPAVAAQSAARSTGVSRRASRLAKPPRTLPHPWGSPVARRRGRAVDGEAG